VRSAVMGCRRIGQRNGQGRGCRGSATLTFSRLPDGKIRVNYPGWEGRQTAITRMAVPQTTLAEDGSMCSSMLWRCAGRSGPDVDGPG
jgi:hypothetical protein